MEPWRYLYLYPDMRYLNVFVLFLLLASCRQNEGPGKPLVPADSLANNLMTWMRYEYDHLELWRDFQPLDSAQQPMKKNDFLAALKTGRYLPLRLASDSQQVYQLHATEMVPDVRSTVIQTAEREDAYFQREGGLIAPYQFTDLNGKIYSNQTEKGRILVIKCWFVNCVPCVAEMPELNKLVASYSSRKDIDFVSLALDTREKLDSFLQTHPFSYAVVPGQENYITNGLGVTEFPTHILVNRKGKVVKIVNSSSDLEKLLEEYLPRL